MRQSTVMPSCVSLVKTSLAVALFSLSSCSGSGNFGSASQVKEAPTSQTEPTASEDGEHEIANEPVMVTGAFLTCALNPADLPAGAAAAGNEAVACGVHMGGLGKSNDYTIERISLQTYDNQTLAPTWKAANLARWHGSFQIARGVFDAVDKITAEVRLGTKSVTFSVDAHTQAQACVEKTERRTYSKLLSVNMDIVGEELQADGKPAVAVLADLPIAGARVRLVEATGKSYFHISSAGVPSTDPARVFDCPAHWNIDLRGADGKRIIDPTRPRELSSYRNEAQKLPYDPITAWIGTSDTTYFDNEGGTYPLSGGGTTNGCTFVFEVTRRDCGGS